MKNISNLFISGLVNCSWSDYKEATPYEQLALNIIANEKKKHDIRLAGGKIRL
jgi:hypothetical protein